MAVKTVYIYLDSKQNTCETPFDKKEVAKENGVIIR